VIERASCALAAAALCAAAGCQPAKRAPPVVPVSPPPVAPPMVLAPDPARIAQDSLAAARARRLRIAQEERLPDPDTAAIAAEAQACAADARRSWAEQFPEAAAQRARGRVGAAGAEALYLEAVCSATSARMQGFTPLIDYKGELIAAFRRVAELTPDLDGAGAERELGALQAALPTYAGGDLEEAREHLLAAVRRAPQDPRNHLVLARTVAVKAQDRALFKEHLEIARACGDEQAARDADALLQREDELFGPRGEAAQPIPGGPHR